jgi:hypothetical protein
VEADQFAAQFMARRDAESEVERWTRIMLDDAAGNLAEDKLMGHLFPPLGLHKLASYLVDRTQHPDLDPEQAVMTAMATILRVCARKGVTHGAVALDRMMDSRMRQAIAETGGKGKMADDLRDILRRADNGPYLVIDNDGPEDDGTTTA